MSAIRHFATPSQEGNSWYVGHCLPKNNSLTKRSTRSKENLLELKQDWRVIFVTNFSSLIRMKKLIEAVLNDLIVLR